MENFAIRAGAVEVRGGHHDPTLYVFGEPTVGLHMVDVEKLIHVLHRLVRAGNSIVLIEHNLDVIAPTLTGLSISDRKVDGLRRTSGAMGAGGIVAERARRRWRSLDL